METIVYTEERTIFFELVSIIPTITAAKIREPKNIYPITIEQPNFLNHQ